MHLQTCNYSKLYTHARSLCNLLISASLLSREVMQKSCSLRVPKPFTWCNLCPKFVFTWLLLMDLCNKNMYAKRLNDYERHKWENYINMKKHKKIILMLNLVTCWHHALNQALYQQSPRDSNTMQLTEFCLIMRRWSMSGRHALTLWLPSNIQHTFKSLLVDH